MKIRMKVSISGARNGKSWPARGEEVEVPDVEGADLCAAGLAEPVATRPAEEKAVPPEPEKRNEPADVESKPVKRGPGRPRKPPAKE